jgi:hypothetical protein
MNKFIGYGILLLIYLGLSKSLSPTELGISYINNVESLGKLVNGAPTTVILTDIHSIGFLIKTYYHKYKVVHGFQSYEEIIVRTSRKYSDEMKEYLGMSVFRRYPDLKETFTPLPPGSIFIGNLGFGKWVKHNSGEKVWNFHRSYRQMPTFLGWMSFLPTKKLHEKILVYEKENKALRGLNNEFGLYGEVTKKKYIQYYERQKPQEIQVNKFLKNYLKENFIK